MSQRFFTPAQVSQLIPELEKIIRHLRLLDNEIQEKIALLRQAKEEAMRRGNSADPSEYLQAEAEIEFLRIVMQTQFQRIEELGGEVKPGLLVDFPGLIDGREVLLCWKPGESSVEWYHGVTEGFAGRRRIPDEYRVNWQGSDQSEENREIH